jgi:hypothetical protein
MPREEEAITTDIKMDALGGAAKPECSRADCSTNCSYLSWRSFFISSQARDVASWQFSDETGLTDDVGS